MASSFATNAEAYIELANAVRDYFIKTPIVRIIGRPIGRIDNIMFGPGAIGVLPGNRPR